jgi:Core-2/I-Branching enzyme
MKAALCFIISYEHSMKKERIWRDWIEENKDIINVYFHYDDYNKIESPWIKQHAIPTNQLVRTSYYHVVPAYLALMEFAKNHSRENIWFIMLTESCVPIISPNRFRRLFFENYEKTIMNWRTAWWNIDFHKRANLRVLKKEYHLANDPWFILKREDVSRCIEYATFIPHMYNLICNGPIANESIFAIMLKSYNKLKNVKNAVTHAADWNRMSSATSPHVFKDGNARDLEFISNFLHQNKYAMFLRKVHQDFPEYIIHDFIKSILPEDKYSFYTYPSYFIQRIYIFLGLCFLVYFFNLFL